MRETGMSYKAEIPYTFKNSTEKALFNQLDLIVQIMFLDTCKFCEENDMPSPIVTSTIRGMLPNSVSNTHEEGRAIDFRSWIYTPAEIRALVKFIDDKYAEYFGTAPTVDISPRCLIYEELEGNEHMHLQCRRDYDLKNLNIPQTPLQLMSELFRWIGNLF